MNNLHTIRTNTIPAIYRAWAERFNDSPFLWKNKILYVEGYSPRKCNMPSIAEDEDYLRLRFPHAFIDPNWIPPNMKIE